MLTRHAVAHLILGAQACPKTMGSPSSRTLTPHVLWSHVCGPLSTWDTVLLRTALCQVKKLRGVKILIPGACIKIGTRWSSQPSQTPINLRQSLFDVP